MSKPLDQVAALYATMRRKDLEELRVAFTLDREHATNQKDRDFIDGRLRMIRKVLADKTDLTPKR